MPPIFLAYSQKYVTLYIEQLLVWQILDLLLLYLGTSLLIFTIILKNSNKTFSDSRERQFQTVNHNKHNDCTSFIKANVRHNLSLGTIIFKKIGKQHTVNLCIISTFHQQQPQGSSEINQGVTYLTMEKDFDLCISQLRSSEAEAIRTFR